MARADVARNGINNGGVIIMALAHSARRINPDPNSPVPPLLLSMLAIHVTTEACEEGRLLMLIVSRSSMISQCVLCLSLLKEACGE